MNSISPRSYNCKDEELPVICGFAAISLTRDLTDFSAFSPNFDAAYLAAYKGKIEVVQELVQPKSETIELKIITDRMYATLDNLVVPLNFVDGYLKLAGKTVPISATDFGLSQLRKSIRSRDVENVMQVLHTVEANLGKYNPELSVVGLTDTTSNKFTDAGNLLAIDKNKKYELVSNRTALVQSNLGILNELFDQFTEICTIGKALYKFSDKAKLKDYTFAQLMKQVRRTAKPAEEKPVATAAAE
jgi:hypothetical protein